MAGLSQHEYNDRISMESALRLINLQIDSTMVLMREATPKRARKAGKQLTALRARKSRLLDEYQRVNRVA